MAHSNLEYSALPELVHRYDGLQPAQPEKILSYSRQDAPELDDRHLADPNWQQRPQEQCRRPRACGLPRWAFWTIVGVTLLIIVAGAVVGSLEATLSQKHKLADMSSTTSISNSTSSSPYSILNTAGPTTTTSSVSLTTNEEVGPTSTLYRDCPSANDTLYSYGSTDTPILFRKYCDTQFYVGAGGDIINAPVQSLSECIDFCASYNMQNETEIASGVSPVCNAVCWRNGFQNDDFPGQCFGSTTQNSSNRFVTSTSTVCDSAAWINQLL